MDLSQEDMVGASFSFPFHIFLHEGTSILVLSKSMPAHKRYVLQFAGDLDESDAATSGGGQDARCPLCNHMWQVLVATAQHTCYRPRTHLTMSEMSAI